ncbi:MAG: sugar transporter permease [Paenibacillaceae bacterium]|jgi:putative aldouronate transport system permease protein|nr:sugar transporter permease [Paenibacillaceae bacterium]
MNMKTATQRAGITAGSGTWRRILHNLKRDRFLYLLIIPFIIWYLVFQYYPMLGLQIAFKKYSIYRGMSGSPWVGLDNFITFFNSPYFLRTLKNTLMINMYMLVFAFPAPIILALLLNEVKSVMFKRTVQTLTYLPHFISIVIVAGFVTNFLSPSTGIINLILEKIGFTKMYFLVVPEYFRTIFVSMNIWRDIGFGSIVYIAALSGINPELHEAATIDGANKWKRVLHVTLPGIIPTIMIMLILRIGSLLEVGFEAIILLYQPSTYEVSDVISTYVYRTGLQDGRYDLGTAVGLFNSVVGLILVIIANKLSKKYTESGLW